MPNTAPIFRRAAGLGGGALSPTTLAGRFVRYCFASASGTVIDLMVFALLLSAGIGVGISAATGYLLGTLWHWEVTSRKVFADRLAADTRRRRRQQGQFFASALLGLILTTCIVKLGTLQGFEAAPAKFAAMCASFTSVWLVRLLFVFAEERS